MLVKIMTSFPSFRGVMPLPDLSSPEAVYYILALTIPAIVFLYARTQFINGRMPPPSEAILYYFAITAIYYGLVYPIILLAHSLQGNWLTWWLGWVVLVFFAPFVLGAFSGWFASNGFVYHALRSLGLKPVHITPTAWEWRAAQCGGEWVVITLKNGNAYGAECGPGSFFSTHPSERDIYVQRTFDILENGEWVDRHFGMLVCASEISTIEFYCESLGDANDQATKSAK